MKMFRKVAILVVMVGTMTMLITGCGGDKKETEETISRQEYLELKEQMDRIEEMLKAMDKREQEEMAQRKQQEDNQQEKSSTEPAKKPEAPKELEELLKIVLIENDYNQNERKPKVFTSSYEAMSEDGTKLNREGKITVMLYGDVQKLEYTDSSSGFVTYEQIELIHNSDYESFEHICEKNVKTVFKATKTDGTELFFTVKR